MAEKNSLDKKRIAEKNETKERTEKMNRIKSALKQTIRKGSSREKRERKKGQFVLLKKKSNRGKVLCKNKSEESTLPIKSFTLKAPLAGRIPC